MNPNQPDSIKLQTNKTYRDKQYSIVIPENWSAQKLSNRKTFFKGTKIGNAYMGIYITCMDKKDRNYKDISFAIKEKQVNKENFTVLEEKDISRSEFKAYVRRSHWFSKEINMELFSREIVTESDTHIFILSSMIPNTEKLEVLDKAMVSIMNTFQFNTNMSH